MTWERHGVVLARVDARHRVVDLVHIAPWLEHDKEAAVTHGLYLVDEATFDVDELEEDSDELRRALASVGLSREEYAGLTPEHKAEVRASYAGYEGESRSVDRLADALPVRPEEIEFWGGKESSDALESYDAEMRREALDSNFETSLTFGSMPEDAALEFALGGASFEMSLEGGDALAFDYATSLAGVSGATNSVEQFAATVQALVSAPSPDELDHDDVEPSVARVLVAWEGRYGDPADEDRGIAGAAQGLAASMMEAIGFTWI